VVSFLIEIFYNTVICSDKLAVRMQYIFCIIECKMVIFYSDKLAVGTSLNIRWFTAMVNLT
jgi:hypothetical protein